MRARWIIITLATLCIAGCNFWEHVDGSGTIISESRYISGIYQVELDGIGEVSVTTGNSESLIIESDDNIIPYITTSVQGNKLTIGTKPGVSLYPSRSIHITAVISDVDRIQLNGSGNFNVSGISKENVDLGLSGSGNIDISGQCTNVSANLSGSGNINADNLRANTASAILSGSGNVNLWATDTLQATLSGSGKIDYYNNPVIKESVSGSGKVRKIGEK